MIDSVGSTGMLLWCGVGDIFWVGCDIASIGVVYGWWSGGSADGRVICRV